MHSVRTALASLALAAGVLTGGCTDKPAVQADDPQLATYFDLVMPTRIEIQRYLTKPISISGDGTADGVEVILAAYDTSEDLTKVAGRFHFELQTQKPSETIGQRVAFWPVDIDSEQKMKAYRDTLSRYYTFRLELENKPLPPGHYLLSVWLQLPTGKRLYGEYEFSYDGTSAPPV